MKPIKFPGHNLTLAENQPEYLPLPVCKQPGPEGSMTSCWQLTVWERLKLLFTGRAYITQLTFLRPLQPQRMEINWTEPICKGCGYGIGVHSQPHNECPTKWRAGGRITVYHPSFDDGAYRDASIIEEKEVVYVKGEGWIFSVNEFRFIN